MNKCAKKAPSVGAVIMISAASASVAAIIFAAVAFSLDSSLKLPLIISLVVLPTIVGVWFLASMVIYTIGKYKGKISAWVDANLRISSIIIGVILLAAAIALTACAICWGTNPLTIISSVLNG